MPDEFGENPTPYYCYIDEFQEFVSLDIAKALDRTRKRGRINCTLPGPNKRWRWFGTQFYIPRE